VHRSSQDIVDFCGGRRHCFATKPTGEGTGLGRSISYDMVTRHSGTISLDRPAPAMSRSAHAIISEKSHIV
jgi:hypothetical protein